MAMGFTGLYVIIVRPGLVFATNDDDIKLQTNNPNHYLEDNMFYF